MKKILMLAILTSTLLFSDGDTNTTTESNITSDSSSTRIQTMQSLESAMAVIQKGFLYNNESIIEKGVNDLKKNLENINSFIIKNEKRRNFNAPVYAATETTAISKLGDKIFKLYKEGRKNQALSTYARTLNRCVVCHKIIRKW
jgi:predicted glycosyltransferase involved in capsule biosynthesis